MSKLKLLSAALIAAAMLATPAMARTSHVTSLAEHANASASPTAHHNGLPPVPPDGENCDVGDNPFIC